MSSESLSALQSIGDVTFNNAFEEGSRQVKAVGKLPKQRSKLNLDKIDAFNMSWDSTSDPRGQPHSVKLLQNNGARYVSQNRNHKTIMPQMIHK